MIQANELRIGNLVNYLCEDNLDDRKEWYEPTVIDWQDLKNLSDRKKRNEGLTPCRAVKPDYAPIPLTEEILLKCGFEKAAGKHGEYFLHKIYNGFRLWKDNIAPNWNAGRKSASKTYWVAGGIKNLHKLQNLYFALTGKELEIDLW